MSIKRTDASTDMNGLQQSYVSLHGLKPGPMGISYYLSYHVALSGYGAIK